MTANLANSFQTYNSDFSGAGLAAPAPLPHDPEACPVKVGFASPTESTTDGRLNLHEHLVRHPLATFFVRHGGEAMRGARLYDGTLLVVDRAETVVSGNLVLVSVNGEFHVRRLAVNKGTVRLCAAHPDYPDLELTPDDQWEIWGRVIYSINQH